MKPRTLILLSFLLAAAPAAMAAKDHGHAHGDDHARGHAEEHAHDRSPKHGGVVSEAYDLEFELVGGSDVRLYVRDHGKAAQLADGSAKLTVVSQDGKQDIDLVPVGDHFAASGARLPAGARIVARVTLDGRTMAVRFAMP